eukprot:6183284-Pleurochrysis_carterae.AAC.1
MCSSHAVSRQFGFGDFKVSSHRCSKSEPPTAYLLAEGEVLPAVHRHRENVGLVGKDGCDNADSDQADAQRVKQSALSSRKKKIEARP